MTVIPRRARLAAAALLACLPGAVLAQTAGLDDPECARTVAQKDPEALAYFWGCRAAGQRPDDPCAAVARLAGGATGAADPEGTLAGRCQHYMHFVRFYLEVSTRQASGFAYPACSHFFKSCPPELDQHAITPDPEPLRDACGLVSQAILTGKKDLCRGAIEKDINPAFGPEQWRHACLSAREWVTGDASECDEPSEPLRVSCVREAAFVRASRFRDPAACAGPGLESGLCRGFTEKPSGPICDDYGSHLAAKFCGAAASRAPHLWRTPYRRALDPDQETARYQRGLDLTPEQAAKVRSILDDAQARMAKVAAAEDADRRELISLGKRMPALNARYEAEDNELEHTDNGARRAVRALLTAEQRRRFDVLETARQQVDRETSVKDQEESERPKDPMPPAGPPGPG